MNSDLLPGTAVECRDANGIWRPMIALGPARYSKEDAFGRPVPLTVPVVEEKLWLRRSPADPAGKTLIYMNWPADDVRLPSLIEAKAAEMAVTP